MMVSRYSVGWERYACIGKAVCIVDGIQFLHIFSGVLASYIVTKDPTSSSTSPISPLPTCGSTSIPRFHIAIE